LANVELGTVFAKKEVEKKKHDRDKRPKWKYSPLDELGEGSWATIFKSVTVVVHVEHVGVWDVLSA
jgi:hypothetical protein